MIKDLIKSQQGLLRSHQQQLNMLQKFRKANIAVLDKADQIFKHTHWKGVFMPAELVTITFKKPQPELLDEILEVFKPLPIAHWVNGTQSCYPILPKNKKEIERVLGVLTEIKKQSNQFEHPHGVACPFFRYPNIEFYGYFKCGGLPLIRITLGDASSVNSRLITYKTVEDFYKWGAPRTVPVNLRASYSLV